MATVKSLRLTFRALALRLSFWRILNYPVILSYRRITTISTETYPLYSFNFSNSWKPIPAFDERVINIMEIWPKFCQQGLIHSFQRQLLVESAVIERVVVVFGFAFTAWLLCSASAENQSELNPSIFNKILVIITWSLSKKRETYHVFQSNKYQVYRARPRVNIGKFLYRMVMKSREYFP